jgi:sigma-B regulation protein RsbU (phosphoserine phosphatase)
VNQSQLADRFPDLVALEKLTAANRRLSQKLQVMSTLFEISNELTLTWDEPAALSLVADAVSGQLMVDSCALYLAEGDRVSLQFSRGFSAGLLTPALELNPDHARSLAGPVTTSDKLNLTMRKRLGGEDLIGLMVPFAFREKLRGLFVLGHRPAGENYVRDDLEFLAILGGMTAATLENIRHFKRSIEQQRVDKDLALARRIQQSLLPPGRLEADWFRLEAACKPAYHVGGDFFDYRDLPGKNVALIIGDVSGKGISASILMSYLLAGLRSLISTGIEPAEALDAVNRILLDSTNPDQFSTLFFGILESDSHSLIYINAGHPPPILLKADETIEKLSKGGMLLGAFSDPRYRTSRVGLDPGDLLVFYTDGVLDARNPDGDTFSSRRLIKAIRRSRGLEPMDVCANILSTIGLFQSEEPQFDDLTLMTVGMGAK